MKIKRYIECNYAPEVCNLKCDYCYLSQEDRKKQRVLKEKYTPKFVRKALSTKRLGGECFISLSVAGETLHSDYIIEIAIELLKEGHIVNITTNGTLNNKFIDLLNRDNVPYDRLLITFSLHYIELIRTNLIDKFWENVKYVKNRGVSYYIKLNLYDKYIPYLDNIIEMCEKNTGDKPQIEVTRKINGDRHTFMTQMSNRNYYESAKEYNSKLFEFTFYNFNKNRKEYFCYAGDWSLVVDLRSGETRGCYCDCRHQNIYNLDQNISVHPDVLLLKHYRRKSQLVNCLPLKYRHLRDDERIHLLFS